MRPESLEHVPKHARTGLEAMNAGKPLAQPGSIQTVLDRYESGEPITAIATSLGISFQAVYRALLSVPDWPYYQAASALADLHEAREVFRNPQITGDPRTDGVELNARTQLARLAQWTLERTCRTLYGDKLEVSHQGQGPILQITVVQAPQIAPQHDDNAGRVIDSKP